MKKELRKKILSERNEYNKKYINEYSLEVFNKVIKQDGFSSFSQILIYSSFRNELELLDCFYKMSLKQKYKLFLPRINTADTTMNFFEYDKQQLVKNEYGINEPTDKCKQWDESKETLAIIPALGVDLNGFRLGYGAGYYDKFLSEYQDVVCWGVGIISDLIQASISEQHDIPLDLLFTNKKIYSFD